jgi:S1-C subfamily serine protease
MSQALELSESLAAAVEKNAASVVRIEARRGSGASGIVWDESVVVTASHVVEWDEGLEVGLAEGRTAKATLAGRDPGTDLAALRVEASGLRPVEFSRDPALKVGQLVLGISRPGQSARARLGVVNALADSWRTPAGARLERYLESDIALHPGFSGSLLTDAAGRALGLNNAGLLRRSSLAVDAQTLRRVVTALLQHGGVRRGFLGIGTYPVRLPRELETTEKQATGLLVLSVQPDSPAAKAGLLLGDALLACDGQPLASPGDLLPLLEEERIGKTVKLRVLRAGEPRELSLTLGAREGRAA